MDNATRAEALVYAAYTSDQEAAVRYGVTTRTLFNWRKCLETDEELSNFFHIKRKEFEQKLPGNLDDAIDAAIGFIHRAAKQMNPGDPVAVETMAGAAKTLTSIQTTRRILDARLKAEEEAQQPAPKPEE